MTLSWLHSVEAAGVPSAGLSVITLLSGSSLMIDKLQSTAALLMQMHTSPLESVATSCVTTVM
jgi:hypothetical protein